MTGPLGLPWPTFSALLVVAGSVVLAIAWAAGSRDGRGGGGDE